MVQGASVVGPAIKGGQKAVFKCEIDGELYALKIIPMSLPSSDDAYLYGGAEAYVEETAGRVERELSIMRKCDSEHLVRLGPLEPMVGNLAEQDCILYVEEWIEGPTVHSLFASGISLTDSQIVELAIDITSAIRVIWSQNKVHRDIKPANIKRKDPSGTYVLLDLGFAFDHDASSLSHHGFPVGTLPWFSPEQCDFSQRRSLDFRSDLFALGTVLYQATTGEHPFLTGTSSAEQVVSKIQAHNPASPYDLGHPNEPLSAIIMRLLAKEKHQRYSNFDRLIEDLSAANRRIGE